MVPLSVGDIEFVRGLRNDPRNAHAFIDQTHISIESHSVYMAEHLNKYFLCYLGIEPAGFVGVVDGDIRLAVSFEHREKGVGRFMLEEIAKIFPDATAKIKIENLASIAAFESAGYKRKFYLYSFDG
jgi:GNAT superfamily N-acetyltransferase